MHQLITFLRYIKDFLLQGEYRFIWIAIRYKIFGITQKKNLIYRSSLGTFITRKGTQDFMFANYAYEWNVKLFFLEHYREINVFIDIGANIGTYSIMMAGKGIRCYAFEPTHENYQALYTNILLNKMEERITSFNIGLGEKMCDTDFIFDPVNTGASHLALNGDEGKHEKVKIRSFDEIYPSLGIRTEDHILVKLDVEGMELEVLRGARGFLQKFPYVFLIIESIHSGEDNIKKTLLEICDFEFIKVDHFNFASKKPFKQE